MNIWFPFEETLLTAPDLNLRHDHWIGFSTFSNLVMQLARLTGQPSRDPLGLTVIGFPSEWKGQIVLCVTLHKGSKLNVESAAGTLGLWWLISAHYGQNLGSEYTGGPVNG